MELHFSPKYLFLKSAERIVNEKLLRNHSERNHFKSLQLALLNTKLFFYSPMTFHAYNMLV